MDKLKPNHYYQSKERYIIMKNKPTKIEHSWILYDIGNSAFILLATTIMPIYFKHLAGNAGISNTDYMAYWGYTASIATASVAFLGPIIGAISDRNHYKKPLFFLCVIIGVIGCSLLGVFPSWISFLAIFVCTRISYSLSLILYDSMLSDITSFEKMDSISSKGFAWGYVGSCVPFLVILTLVLNHKSISISFPFAIFLAFVITAFWWLLFSIPLLRNYRQIHADSDNQNGMFRSFRQLAHTLKDITKHHGIFLFLLAYFFYIDGVYTIIDMATVYGESVGLHTSGLLLALLLTQIIAFPFALLFGRLSKAFATERLITICIIAYTGIALFAIQLNQQWEFWLLAICVGIFQGGIQALSRSYFAKIIPAEKSGEYFGILDIFGKGASFIGTGLVGYITQLTGSSGAGVSVITVLMVLGLIFFRISIRQKQ